MTSLRLLELHSPDGQHTVVLRCKDGPTANTWFTAIHTNIAALLPQTLAHINAYLGASTSGSTHPHLKHIGWLAEQVFSAVILPGLLMQHDRLVLHWKTCRRSRRDRELSHHVSLSATSLFHGYSQCFRAPTVG